MKRLPKISFSFVAFQVAISLHLISVPLQGSDWPQWRGSHRDAKAPDFKAPKTWPKELTQKWKIVVGEGVATPALVGDKLYVFSREDGNEVLRCLNAADGKEFWQDKYESLGATGPASPYSGPRSSPAVADGKIVAVGVRGMISCLDAATGKKLWRKDDFKAWPTFFPSSSPIVVNQLCIAQLGGKENGAVVAYDLTTGDEKWKWTGESPGYASPVLMTVGGTKLIIAETDRRIVAVNAADGALVWETPYPVPNRGYNASTPLVDGQTLVYAGSGRGTKAVKIEKAGDKFVEKELWSTPDKSVQFNSPLLKDGLIYGLTPNNEFFCINAKDGQTAWSAPFPTSEPAPGTGAGGEAGGGRRRGGGGSGYGSIVDAGSVLMALTPGSQLVVFEPNDKEFKKLASYKVADTPTHAHPVLSGNRIYVKDKDSLILWTVE